MNQGRMKCLTRLEFTLLIYLQAIFTWLKDDFTTFKHIFILLVLTNVCDKIALGSTHWLEKDHTTVSSVGVSLLQMLI